MGHDHPCPGTSYFHATFFLGAQVSGGSTLSVTTPVPPAPRNCGQSAPRPTVAVRDRANRARRRIDMVGTPERQTGSGNETPVTKGKQMGLVVRSRRAQLRSAVRVSKNAKGCQRVPR